MRIYAVANIHLIYLNKSSVVELEPRENFWVVSLATFSAQLRQAIGLFTDAMNDITIEVMDSAFISIMLRGG